MDSRGILLTRPAYDMREEPAKPAPKEINALARVGEKKKLSLSDYKNKKTATPTPAGAPTPSSNSSVLVALSACPREEQQYFFTLSNPYKGHLLPALGIFKSNALDLPGDESEGEHAGLFLLGSRFNSSCTPNVSKCWDPVLHTMLFRTLRDVEEGEELCFNYCEILGTRQQRREEIAQERHFECRCDVCELADEESRASDDRRSTIARLFEDVAGCGKEPTLGIRKVRETTEEDGNLPLTYSLQIKLALRLLKEERLVHYETSFCYDAFQFCVMVCSLNQFVHTRYSHLVRFLISRMPRCGFAEHGQLPAALLVQRVMLLGCSRCIGPIRARTNSQEHYQNQHYVVQTDSQAIASGPAICMLKSMLFSFLSSKPDWIWIVSWTSENHRVDGCTACSKVTTSFYCRHLITICTQ